ncbi:MAG: DNA-methyltransferase [Chromatiales bacterium]
MVTEKIGRAAPSSVRSYLRLNTPQLFERTARGHYAIKEDEHPAYFPPAARHDAQPEPLCCGRAQLYLADCLEWLRGRAANSIHAVVTDPPYGLFEYAPEQIEKLRNGRGGVWRIPPSFDGAKRSPLPRFTVLTARDHETLDEFFFQWSRALNPVLVPGANVVVASNPLVSFIVSGALARAGLERRGELVRLVTTMRGGDRPKAAHEEFSGVSVMPRAMWEPWLVFRKPLEGRVQDNLRRWKTGGFRRPSRDKPFGDVIASAPTHKSERSIAPHPSLKPQGFLRQLVRAVLPLGEGVILDPFAGSGSTLAAAEAVEYESIGIEKDKQYFEIARRAIPKLAVYRRSPNYSLSL